jgi:signal peptide peptidase SppA
MTTLRLDGIRRALATQLWLLHPEFLEAMMDVLVMRANGVRLSDEEITDRIAAAEHGALGARATGGETVRPAGSAVAVIPIFGVIAHRASMVNSMSGPRGTSVESVRQQFDAALNNEEVGSIVLDVDSPGGSITGVPELARHILGARGTKPIVAIANGMMASAAYWLGSAADEVVVTPSGEAGSIGVYTVHEDLSGMLAAKGVTVNVIKAGKFKAEGHPAAPLSDEAREALQSRVDEAYEMFTDAVGKQRGVTGNAGTASARAAC